MMAHAFQCLPTSKYHTWVCSAGPKGYCAVKEMVQNGVPGHTLLIESGDLREVDASNVEGSCIFIHHVLEGHTIECCYTNYVNGYCIPSAVRHVAVYGNSRCIPRVKLGEGSYVGFLSGSTGLTTVDLSPLSLVSEIHEGFLGFCTSLTELDLGPLSNIKEVPAGFLTSTALTEIDLSPLSQVTMVHGPFLEGCGGLTSIDLSPFSQVMEFEDGFLERTDIDVVENAPPLCTPPYGWCEHYNPYTSTNQWIRYESDEEDNQD